jgi:hypothetical protein
MIRTLVLCDSSHGHVRALAQAQAEGVRSVPRTRADVRRIPETVPLAVRERAGFQADDTLEIAIADLTDCDAILLGTPTHFGTMAGADGDRTFVLQDSQVRLTEVLVDDASAAGFEAEAFRRGLSDPRTRQAVAADRALAQRLQVRQVPSVHGRGTGGWLRNGSIEQAREQVRARIDRVGARPTPARRQAQAEARRP